MRTVTLEFYEVEHEGDLAPIIKDLTASGARIVRERFHEDGEVVSVTIEVPDLAAFRKAFLATDSAEWLN